MPIDLRIYENFYEAVARYKHFDLLMVNSIFDGMNLVAKEAPAVNTRDGVLMLSEYRPTAWFGGLLALTMAVAFLAEVTDDLEFRRLEVRRYLEQQGIVVLPEASLPLGRTQFEVAIDADLARSRVFVQLLGPIPGGFRCVSNRPKT